MNAVARGHGCEGLTVFTRRLARALALSLMGGDPLRYIAPQEIQTLDGSDTAILHVYVGCQCTHVVWCDLGPGHARRLGASVARAFINHTPMVRVGGIELVSRSLGVSAGGFPIPLSGSDDLERVSGRNIRNRARHGSDALPPRAPLLTS